jgi:hypothetical protein
MENAVERPSIDIGPQQSRPGLALVLALLAVPGSTIVWDLPLPAPGLWIGLPLGVAAIVLGLRARRELAGGSGSVMATVAIGIAALMIAQMVVWFVVEAF